MRKRLPVFDYRPLWLPMKSAVESELLISTIAGRPHYLAVIDGEKGSLKGSRRTFERTIQGQCQQL